MLAIFVVETTKDNKAIAFSDDAMNRLDVTKLCCDDYCRCSRGTSNLYGVLKHFFME